MILREIEMMQKAEKLPFLLSGLHHLKFQIATTRGLEIQNKGLFNSILLEKIRG